jgi:hypothetical protein
MMQILFDPICDKQGTTPLRSLFLPSASIELLLFSWLAERHVIALSGHHVVRIIILIILC